MTNYPAHFFVVMSSFPQYLVCAWLFLLLADTGSTDAAPSGFIEGHLNIISPKEVELADATPPSSTAANYADYPLTILSRDGQNEIARMSADENGNYRMALPPGDYVLDVRDRRRRHVRATPQPFTVASNQTVHVNLSMDTGIR